MTVGNKPQHGDLIVVAQAVDGSPVRGGATPPFQEYIDDLTEQSNDNDELLASHIADLYAHRPALMNWKNKWDAEAEYLKYDVVLDGAWLMIANKDTTEPAAPVTIGEPFNVYLGTIDETNDLASQIVFGNRYQFTGDGYIQGYRIYTITGNHYVVYSITNPTSNPILRTLLNFTADDTGWVNFTIADVFIQNGAFFDLVATVNEPDPTPTVETYNYNYQTPQNVGIPLQGQISHGRSQADVMRINYIDSDGQNRETFLKTLDVGDIIAGAGQRWAIQNIGEELTYINFGINPALTGAPVGVQPFEFETVTPTPITYAEDIDYWATSEYAGEVFGLLGIDIPYESIVPNDTAYGTDLLVQFASVSEDWDQMAHTGIVGGGASSIVRTEIVAQASSYVDQDPPGLGVPIQIGLEVVQVNSTYFTIDAAGLATCLVSGDYTVAHKLAVGREGAGGDSQIYTRALINGVPVGDTTHTIVDTARIEIPQFVDNTVFFSVGDTLALEIIRDTDGNDSGGLRAGNPDVVGWASSPSARVRIIRTYTA